MKLILTKVVKHILVKLTKKLAKKLIAMLNSLTPKTSK